MRRLRAKVLPALVACIFGGALPALACVPTLSNLDEAFGVGQLGQPYAELLPTIQPKGYASQCIGLDDKGYDCAFKDDAGIEYNDEGKGIFDKGFNVRDVKADVLPFGLTPDDKLTDVVKKTERYRKRRYAIKKEGLYATYSSGPCYVNRRGQIFEMGFDFDHEGYLSGISAYASGIAPPPRDPTQ